MRVLLAQIQAGRAVEQALEAAPQSDEERKLAEQAAILRARDKHVRKVQAWVDKQMGRR